MKQLSLSQVETAIMTILEERYPGIVMHDDIVKLMVTTYLAGYTQACDDLLEHAQELSKD